MDNKKAEAGDTSFGAVLSGGSTSSSSRNSPLKDAASSTTTDGAETGSSFSPSESPRGMGHGAGGGLVEAFLSQVDEEGVESIIAAQKKS